MVDWVVDCRVQNLESAGRIVIGDKAPRSDIDSVFESSARERDHGAVGHREVDHGQQSGRDSFLRELVVDEFGQGSEQAHGSPIPR